MRRMSASINAALPSVALTIVKLVAPSGPMTANADLLIWQIVDSISYGHSRLICSFQGKRWLPRLRRRGGLTTKGAKSTKFGVLFFRVIRNLPGESLILSG